MISENETEEFNRCVCGCREFTNVRKDTPISKRHYYIEGAGQLKSSCYERIYSDERKRREELEAKLWLRDIGIILN